MNIIGSLSKKLLKIVYSLLKILIGISANWFEARKKSKKEPLIFYSPFFIEELWEKGEISTEHYLNALEPE